MNGGQDLGGMMGFGPVKREAHEPAFHDEWERRIFALTVSMGAAGKWNLDMSRHARETLPVVKYLSSSYYQIWLEGLSKLLIEKGLVTSEELAEGRHLADPAVIDRILHPEDVEAALRRGGPVDRNSDKVPGFKPGDIVRAINMHPTGHTRLPRYVRGRRGRINRINGCHVFPDSNARGVGENPQWLYNVRFTADELWGSNHNSRDHVHLDLWESYLEPE